MVYEEPIYDTLYHSLPAEYTTSMERLSVHRIETIHGGHWASFGRSQIFELIDDFLQGTRKLGCPK